MSAPPHPKHTAAQATAAIRVAKAADKLRASEGFWVLAAALGQAAAEPDAGRRLTHFLPLIATRELAADAMDRISAVIAAGEGWNAAKQQAKAR